jgi:hypothetical protein
LEGGGGVWYHPPRNTEENTTKKNHRSCYVGEGCTPPRNVVVTVRRYPPKGYVVYGRSLMKNEWLEQYWNFLVLENFFIGPIVFATQALENCFVIFDFLREKMKFWEKYPFSGPSKTKRICSIRNFPGLKSFKIVN